MQYKVVPFQSGISRGGSSADVAKQLQQVIDTNIADGWEYVSMESVETQVAGTSGCFGLGAKPPFTVYAQVIVFKK